MKTRISPRIIKTLLRDKEVCITFAEILPANSSLKKSMLWPSISLCKFHLIRIGKLPKIVWYLRTSAKTTRGMLDIRNRITIKKILEWEDQISRVGEPVNQSVISPNIANNKASNTPIKPVEKVNKKNCQRQPSLIAQANLNKLLGGAIGFREG